MGARTSTSGQDVGPFGRPRGRGGKAPPPIATPGPEAAAATANKHGSGEHRQTLTLPAGVESPASAATADLPTQDGPKAGSCADRPSLIVAVPPDTPRLLPLSPNMALLFLDCSAGGRTKRRQWADEDGDEFDDDHPAYLDVARHPAKPVTAPPARAQTRSVVVVGCGGVDAG